MIILISLTAFVILLYLAYPVWLAGRKPVNDKTDDNPETIGQVSLILLSYNGSQFLKEKIDFLLKELAQFEESEFIVIDDCSDDRSREILGELKGKQGIRIIQKDHHKGIPDSMNMAVELAKYDCIVFCDQRQQLTTSIIKKLVEPLADERIGAVSACISDHDKTQHFSWIRSYENYVKCKESRIGSLIGVYGPLYAIRKRCYSPVPAHIELDDLYLSLRILAKKQVRIMKDCLITDDSLSALNDYHRAKRYIMGFLQIMQDQSLLHALTKKQKLMLYWHKYLRLHIPLLLLACYLGMGIKSFFTLLYLYPFIITSIILFILSLPARFGLHLKLKNLLKINAFYLFAFVEVNALHYFRTNNLSKN